MSLGKHVLCGRSRTRVHFLSFRRCHLNWSSGSRTLPALVLDIIYEFSTGCSKIRGHSEFYKVLSLVSCVELPWFLLVSFWNNLPLGTCEIPPAVKVGSDSWPMIVAPTIYKVLNIIHVLHHKTFKTVYTNCNIRKLNTFKMLKNNIKIQNSSILFIYNIYKVLMYRWVIYKQTE
jgi:hypothetical protein